MDEKKRTKLLAGVLGLAVMGYFGKGFVTNTYMAPVNAEKRKAEAAQVVYERMEQQNRQLELVRASLNQWREISVPENANNAQRLYREWIDQLAVQCGFMLTSEVSLGTRSVTKNYLTTSVEVEAETDLEGLSRFLYRFKQADLLHRIASLRIESSGTQGNPRLEIKITAEAMSVIKSADRPELFARTTLPAAITESATELTVAATDDFPAETPFLARVGGELVRVTSISDSQWTIVRGLENTKPQAHKEDTIVELFPVSDERQDWSFDRYSSFLAESMFAKPAPPKQYTPRLAGASDKSIHPGDEVRLTLKGEGLDPALGTPQFTLLEAAEGMTLDPASGEFVWQAPEALAAGKYTAKVGMTQTDNPELTLETSVAVTVTIPNAAPSIEIPTPPVVVLGREFTLQATATDPDAGNTLKFALGSGAPQGLAIDPQTGKLTWAPEITFRPGTYDVEVMVTDSAAEPKSASKKLQLKVEDDSAILTLYIGSFATDNQTTAWFRNLGNGTVQKLHVGEQIAVADIAAELVSIDDAGVRMRDEAGVWIQAPGKHLRERVLIEPAPETVSPEPTAPTTTAADKTSNPENSTSEAVSGASNGAATATNPAAEPTVPEQTTTTEPPVEAKSPAAETPAAETPAAETPAAETEA